MFKDFSKFEQWLLDFAIYYLCHHGVEEPLFSQISPQYINNILSEKVGLIFQFKSDAFEDGSTTEEFLEKFQKRARELNLDDES